MSEVPELTSDAEMIWAKLSTPKQKPLYFCSFYRIPNTDSCPIISLNETLLKLHQMVPNPEVLLSGDFNFPGISWLEGGIINSDPAYGYGINQLFLDTNNEYGLEQLITQPTHGSNILDLVFCSQLGTISGIKIIPGISDHEAIFFHLDSINNFSIQKTSRHPILLYHKGNLDGLKTEMLEFQNQFMITNPYSFDILSCFTIRETEN